MPLFIDAHKLGNYTKQQLEESVSDIPDEFGVIVHNLYFNKDEDVLYCICESPSKEAIIKHHQTFNIKCDSITEVDQATTPLLSKAERLMAVGEVASRITHDLRGPLTAIKGTIDLIIARNNNLDKKTISDLDRIEKTIMEMSNQIEEILNHVRITPTKIAPNSLGDIIRLDTDYKGITIKCDSTKLDVVFTNLLRNAIDAIENQGIISIKAKEDGDKIKIEISDSGTGISKENMSKIFEPLFTTKRRGTGLGLISCKRIIEEHGGQITVKSTPPKGATFTIILPK
jgi:two-component system sensor histidine kinase HydH